MNCIINKNIGKIILYANFILVGCHIKKKNILPMILVLPLTPLIPLAI